MNILHITPHCGGGVGTVLMDWLYFEKRSSNNHRVISLDTVNEKARKSSIRFGHPRGMGDFEIEIMMRDIVVLHYWHHPMLKEFLSRPLPPCRLIAWCHNNSPYSQAEFNYPDLWLDTSPVQNHGRHIWSTGNMAKFFEIKPKERKGFNVGYVGTVDYKKLHPRFIEMCLEIAKFIPGVNFTVIGKDNINQPFLPNTADWKTMPSRISCSHGPIHFIGQVADVAPFLAEMDVFFYPLRPDHYGTCEQALGEAMAAGVVPVVMDNPAENIIIGDYENNGYIAVDEQEAVEYIKELYRFPEIRNPMSCNARRRARQLYNINTMISEWDAVFEEVMKMPKRERGTLC